MLKLERLLGLVVCLFAISLSFRITFTWIVLIAGLVAWLLWKVVSLRNHRGKLSYVAVGPLALPLAAYALAVTISGLGRGDYGHLTLKEVLASAGTLRAFVVYFWAFDVFKNCPSMRVPAIFCMLLTAGASGLVASVQQLRNWHPWSLAYAQGTGFFSEPMAFSGVMQIFSLMSLGLLLTGGYRRFPRPFNLPVVFLVVALSNVVGLVFAGERGAWVGFAVAALFMTAFISLRITVAGAGALGLLGAGGWFMVPMLRQRFESTLSAHSDTSITSRFEVWNRAYHEFLKSPITGIGTTKFPHLELPGATQLGKPYLAHAHNNVLQILSTAGIIGLCTYIWITASSLIVGAAHWSRNSKFQSWIPLKSRYERGVALGIIGALISLTVSGLTEYNFGTGQVRLALWFVLALLATD